MGFRIAPVLLLAALGLFCIGAHATAAPLEAYGRLPTLEDVAISPDGAHLAYVTVANDKRVVIVFDVAAHRVLTGLNVSDQKLRDLIWADSQHLLITISQTTRIGGGPRQEYFMTLSYDLNTRALHNLLERVSGLNVVLGAPEPRTVNGRTMVFVQGVQAEGRGRHVELLLALFAVDLSSNRAKAVESSSGSAGWIVDSNGNAVAQTNYDESHQRWTLKLKSGNQWKEAFSQDAPIDVPQIGGISPDGKSLLIRDTDEETAAWKALNLADRTWNASLGEQYQVSRFIRDPATHLIIGGQRDTTRTHYIFFNPEDEAVWENITLSLDGENIELVSWSNDRHRIALRVSGTRSGAAYLFVDLNEHRTMRIGDAYADIAPADVAPVKAITYKAADGLTIPAYLTLPQGRDATMLPLIVLVHGGPAARDNPGFDWWSQALASRGYAVLQPEFRGSNGFTSKFLAAGYGEWGRKMQSDVSDGVRDLAKQGVIDPARVCIIGGSYGGYAALAGVTLESGVYRCAVSVAGVSDPHTMLASIQSHQWRSSSRTLRYWDRFMGVEGAKDKRLEEISPLSHAAQAGAPILLIHGRDDTVVPIEQSELMEKALQRAGKPVQFVRLQSEDHWLSRTETRLQMLQEAAKFLEANNPPFDSASSTPH